MGTKVAWLFHFCWCIEVQNAHSFNIYKPDIYTSPKLFQKIHPGQTRVSNTGYLTPGYLTSNTQDTRFTKNSHHLKYEMKSDYISKVEAK